MDPLYVFLRNGLASSHSFIPATKVGFEKNRTAKVFNCFAF